MRPMRESDLRRALHELRKSKKITQKQAAKAVGHVQGWVSDHETGKANLTIDDAHALAEAYGHSLIVALLPKGDEAADLSGIWGAMSSADRRVMVALSSLVAEGRLAGPERRLLDMIVAAYAEGT